jgi:hypothetical protein
MIYLLGLGGTMLVTYVLIVMEERVNGRERSEW